MFLALPVKKLAIQVTLRGTCILRFLGEAGVSLLPGVGHPHPDHGHFAATGTLLMKTVSLPTSSSGRAEIASVYQGSRCLGKHCP